jgi:hypothetical protein
MNMFKLQGFFLEMLRLSYLDYRPEWGNPCSYLLERLILRQEGFLNKIKGDFTNRSHEMRLNGAGLKLWWSVEKNEKGFRKFTCHIGGDQAKDYPMFTAQVKKLIIKYGYDRR